MQSCQSKNSSGMEDLPFGEPVIREAPSLFQDDPQVLAQKLFEADEKASSKVGPLVLRDWMQNGQPIVLDLTNEKVRKKWGPIKGFQRWDGKTALSVNQSDILILVAANNELGKLNQIENKMVLAGYSSVYILDGGIEAWVKIFGER